MISEPLLPFPTKHIPKESSKALAAYQEYEALGPTRSIRLVGEKLGKSGGYLKLLERWSAQFHWVERARQYDAQEAEKRRKKNAEAIERMNDEQALIGRTHLLRAVTAMEPLLKGKEEIDEKTGKKTGRIITEAPFPSLVSLFKYSAELERLARGAATSRLEGDVSIVVQPKEYIGIEPDECGSEE